MARSRVFVARSALHGCGVFASARLKRGDYIAEAQGTPTETDGPNVLWVLGSEGSHYGLRLVNHLRYLNHSPKPNSNFWGTELYAIRGIGPGEEITFDYTGR